MYFVKKIFYFSIFILGCLPYLLPNYYDPWRTAYQDFAIFGLFLLLLLNLIFTSKKVIVDKRIIIVLIISIIPLLQFFFDKIYFFGDAFLASIYILSFGLTIFLGLNYGRLHSINNTLNFISAIIITVSVISTYIVLKQWLLLTNGGIWTVDVPSAGRPFANFAQPNNCATFLCIGLMSSLYLYEKRYINNFSALLLACFILFGIALTQSRTAWLFFLCFTIWWCWKYKIIKSRLGKKTIFYLIGIFTIFVTVIPYMSTLLGVLATNNVVERATTGYLRIPMWNQMLLAISKEPLLGYGWNQVSVAQLSVYLQYPTTEWTEHSHNIILDLLIWNGIPIATFILIGIAFWFYYLNKIMASFETFIALAMVGVVLVHAMLEFPHDYAFFLLPVGFILGLVQSIDGNRIYIKFSSQLFYRIIPLLAIVYVWVLIEYKVLESDTRLLRFELLNIGSLHSQYDAPNVVLLTHLRERNRFSRTEPTVGMSYDQLRWMHVVSQRYATSDFLYRYAQALALNEQEVEAKRHLLIIQKLYGRTYTYESLFNKDATLAFKWNELSGSK